MSSPEPHEIAPEGRRQPRSVIVEKSCEGLHVALRGLPERPEAALAELLAGRESRGERVPVVTLLVRDRHDADVIPPALAWLSSRGRRVIVRTRVVLAKPIVRALAEAHERGASVVVELELAHHKPVIQRALLGPQADAASALLLQAQHLETLGLPVVARLGPILPGIHDHGGPGQKVGLEPLLRNVEAADLRRVVLEVGELEPAQITALVRIQRELSTAGLLELGKAFGIDPMVMLGAVPIALASAESHLVRRLKPRRAAALIAGLEQLVRAAGLELPACGCQSHCALARPRPANDYEIGYEAVMGRDLFAGLAY
ncbi:hypothetical protein ACNOYE_01735 [Nannocystaceae bacterium ST9]